MSATRRGRSAASTCALLTLAVSCVSLTDVHTEPPGPIVGFPPPAHIEDRFVDALPALVGAALTARAGPSEAIGSP